MAKIQLSGLPETTISANTDLFHISKGGVDYRITRENVLLSLAETIEAVDGATVALPWANTQVMGDTTAGDASITIPDGVYLNQEITLSNQGTGFATFTHPDFSYGIIVGPGYNVKINWVSDGVGGFKYDVGSQVSAEYESDIWRVKLSTNRTMVLLASTGVVGTGVGTDLTFPMDFIDVVLVGYFPQLVVAGSPTRNIVFDSSALSSTASKIKLISDNVSASGSLRIEGDYA